jgi:uncharacterized damage-inducible protein DinB
MADHPSPPAHGPLDLAGMAASLSEQRAALLEALERLPEAQLYRPAPREGWTLRHVLSFLAAADAELLRVLEALGGEPGAVSLHLRRLRGEAMYEAHGLRLTGLRDHLAASTERAAAALEQAPSALDRPVALDGREGGTVGEYLRAYLSRTAEALELVSSAVSR